MAKNTPFAGGCACGAIRYEITTDANAVFLCSCRDCQRATAGASTLNWWCPVAAVNFTQGNPSAHTVTGEMSGAPVHHEFCAACGSPVGMRSEAFPDFRALRAVSLDEPGAVKPVAQLWTSRKPTWYELAEDLPDYPNDMPGEVFVAYIKGNG